MVIISSSASWPPPEAQIWMLLKHGKQRSGPALFFSEGVNGLGLVLSLYSTYHNFNGLYSLFQLLKLILLQLLCLTETRSVCGWGTGARRGFGCSLKRLVAGREVAGISLSQVLRRTCSLVLIFSGIPRLSCRASLCQFSSLPLFPGLGPFPAPLPAWALLSTLAPLCTWVVAHTLKLLFLSFNNILQLISCFLADSHSKSNLWQVLIWVMTTWSTFLVGNYWVRSEQIWYPLTVSEAGIFTTPSLEIHG